MNKVIKEYYLSGDGKVTVLKPFEGPVYSAVVAMSGRYPEEGSIARNYKRDEFIFIISGELNVTLNGVSTRLRAGQTMKISDGSSYFISGQATSLVMVKDGDGGETLIEEM